jgi:uncharacterized protein (TIGR00369 family)
MTDTPRTADLDQLREIFSIIPHCQEMGFEIISLEPGKAAIRMEYQDCLIGNPESGVVHGGVISTLLDTASGLSAMSAVSETMPVATLDLRIDYLKPATPGIAIIGEGDCFRLSKSVAFIRGVAHQGDRDDPVAHCIATFMLGAAGFTSEKKRQA